MSDHFLAARTIRLFYRIICVRDLGHDALAAMVVGEIAPTDSGLCNCRRRIDANVRPPRGCVHAKRFWTNSRLAGRQAARDCRVAV